MKSKEKKSNQESKIPKTLKRPRLVVFKSLKNIYGQIIDDNLGKTLVSASSLEIKVAKNKAQAVGEALAKKALAKKITTVTFDRRKYKYHGQVKALAEGARAGGLKI